MVENNKKKTFKEKLKKWARRMILPLILFHTTTQIYYTGHEIKRTVNFSQERRSFYSEFGFNISGWESDLEGSNSNLGEISEVIYRERTGNPFDLTSLNISSDNYLKKSIPQQIWFTLIGEKSFYNPLTGNLSIEEKDTFNYTLHHEIKHLKTYDILKQKPSLLKDWESLSKDEDGDIIYLNATARLFKRFSLLDKLIGENLSIDDYFQLGFICDSARTGVLEDIAETCATAECDPELISSFFNMNDIGARIVQEKIRLAEKIGLINKGYEEYIGVFSLGVKANSMVSTEEERRIFLVQSDKFLERYPESVHNCSVRQMRGKSLSIGLSSGGGQLDNSIKEYKRSLKADFKPRSDYLKSLYGLKIIYMILGDKEKIELFDSAIREYRERDNNIYRFRDGVNDYLESKGYSLN